MEATGNAWAQLIAPSLYSQQLPPTLPVAASGFEAQAILPNVLGQQLLEQVGGRIVDPNLWGQQSTGFTGLPPVQTFSATAVPGLSEPPSIQAAPPPAQAATVPATTLDRSRNPPLHRGGGSGTRFSGAPLWRFSLKRDEQRRQQEVENQRQGVPEGFVRHSEGMFYHPQQKIFWQTSTQKFYTYNDATKAYAEIQQEASTSKELRLCVDASCMHRVEGVKEHRHVIIRDLVKAGQSLRMPIDHLPRPCTLLAIYDNHRAALCTSEGNIEVATPIVEEPLPACAEFCARNFHLKLLARLTAFQGIWDDAKVVGALRDSCVDLDTDFLERSKNATDGCSAVLVLVVGQKSFTASLGAVVAILVSELENGQHEACRQTVAHSMAVASERQRVCVAGGAMTQIGQNGVPGLRAGQDGKEVLHVSRAFGDRNFKAVNRGAVSVLTAVPDVRVASLNHRHCFLALVCNEVAHVLRDEMITDILRRRSGRPRTACGALLQEARLRGATGSLTALCVFFEWQAKTEKADESALVSQAAKKARLDSAAASTVGAPKQVRCRHILVRHKDSKEPVDRVRNNKPVTRSLAEAERILREALEAIESSPEKSVFTQRCKAVSECSTSLKGGEMAGDLGWMSRGQAHAAVEVAAFALPVGHISDIVESDEGVHVLWRIA